MRVWFSDRIKVRVGMPIPEQTGTVGTGTIPCIHIDVDRMAISYFIPVTILSHYRKMLTLIIS